MLAEIANAIGGELRGDRAKQISGAASLAEATPDEISFFYHPRYLSQLRRTAAAAVIVPSDFAEEIGAATIRVSEPAKAFEEVVLRFAPPPVQWAPGIHPTAVIDPSAVLAADVSIQPHAVIEAGTRIGDGSVIGAGSYIGHDVVIGRNCMVYPGVTIRERCRLGARVILHSGAVIGADGFGFEMTSEGQRKVPQIGIVQIDDDVEIGANTTIDRARFGRTWVQQGAKIDNLVQVAHNVIIGKHTVIAAQTGIAGSVRIGQRVMIGGQAGIIGHIEISDGTMIGAQTGVSKNLDGGVWWATPSVPLKEAKVHLAWVRRLGELFERVKRLEGKGE
ncbi:MAG: UDP-3-O-(3-hydroxymyristoyl)glucosamine N-acyltransferase [Verrucomicrobia bacterium]|nr:UDP-3-O-(3-hydroxymyristoyl)glucosamine N-acyltransferase [Verrucomicrobiota bacterium]